MVFNHKIVETLIINKEAEAAVWLLIEQYESTCRRFRRLNKPGFQIDLGVSL